MAAPTVKTRYISVACNRVPNSLSWGGNGHVAFGANTSVAIYDSQGGDSSGINRMLNGHQDRVNCVKWIQCPTAQADAGCQEIVSGSSDNTLKVWKLSSTHQSSCVATLKGHTATIAALDTLYLPPPDGALPSNPRTLIASVSADSTVRIWERLAGEEEEFTEKQVIACGSGFAMAAALCVIPTTTVPILAIGGDDSKVNIYVERDGTFDKVQSLVGHEDWIRGLQFAIHDNGDLLLASCSQDCFIRIWRISPVNESSENINGQPEVEEIRLKENCFSLAYKGSDLSFAVSLESVMAGHEQWVYEVHWQPAIYSGSTSRHQEMCLLSASMDKTMIIWRPDEESGVWLDQVRVGEVGGNTLGLYGCQFSPDGMSIMAHGFQGAIHLWTKLANQNTESQVAERWSPSVAVGGHYDGVQDLDWDPEGTFLVSVSVDQTTRLHACWRREGNQTSWHEIARPQVHGYDMQCIAMVGRFKFVSGADEKVLRIFEAPRNFLENLSKISQLDLDEEIKERKSQAEGASVPALGLSNKAVFSGEGGMPASDREITHPSELYPEIYFALVNLTSPPTEEHLLQNTLWPETQKLYGHGFEIFCVAAHPAGNLIASVCKASKAEYASIIIWDTEKWHQVCQLAAHSLTVTQMAFSHSGHHLLSVSRDRTWAIFHQPSSEAPFQLIAKTDKKTSVHTRIIWSCCWSHDDKFFATASRDKKVIIWGQSSDGEGERSTSLGGYGPASSPLTTSDAVTAVDFAPIISSDNSYMLAVGLESGLIAIYKWRKDTQDVWTQCVTFDSR
ncbi:elongator complex protein 2-like [Amphiura filiformis]|uniref:elongator complex protein 2-like n=1 Tax=Amphiura filiformis TaxID=82378 RepID=UPI003B227ED1